MTGLGMAIEQQIQELVRVEVAKSISKVIENLPEQEPVDPVWMTAKDFCRKYTIARSTLQRMKEQGQSESPAWRGGNLFGIDGKEMVRTTMTNKLLFLVLRLGHFGRSGLVFDSNMG